jgi:hypothetical protein
MLITNPFLENLILKLILFIFLFISLLESQHTPNLPQVEITTKKFKPLTLLIITLCSLALIISLILFAPSLVTRYYILTMLSFSIIGHALWLGKTQTTKLFLSIFALFIIAGKLLYDNQLTHNLFVISAITWLGPFLVNSKLVTIKRFFYISLIWFLYDIFYVWLTPTAHAVSAITQQINFPLGIIFNFNLLGTGDLLWATILLALQKTTKQKLLTIVLLTLTSIALTATAFITRSFRIFPLLVLWVPIGLTMLKAQNNSSK